VNPRSPDEIVTEVELTLDMPRVVLIAALALLLLAAAYALGRATASPSATQEAGRGERPSPVEESSASTVFDRATDANTTRPGWELDLGTVVDRSTAETRRGLALKAGVAAIVVRTPQGSFRVAAGPFESESAARFAANKLDSLPPGSVRIVPRSR
jgi:cell division septation protein DedD